jgi:hypothetical protein
MILAPNRFSHIQLKMDSSKFLGVDANVGQAEEELAVRGRRHFDGTLCRLLAYPVLFTVLFAVPSIILYVLGSSTEATFVMFTCLAFVIVGSQISLMLALCVCIECLCSSDASETVPIQEESRDGTRSQPAGP